MAQNQNAGVAVRWDLVGETFGGTEGDEVLLTETLKRIQS